MAVRRVLLLGNPALYVVSSPVSREEVPGLRDTIADLRDTLLDFRHRRSTGSAMSAPQIGVAKRLVYVDTPLSSRTRGFSGLLINPAVHPAAPEMSEVWESCMSFPELLVKTRRARACTLMYRDESWIERSAALSGDLSIVAQHECDHLDGILAVSRAADARSFCMFCQRSFLALPHGAGYLLRAGSGEC